jgi:hypothetical protein
MSYKYVALIFILIMDTIEKEIFKFYLFDFFQGEDKSLNE